VKWLECFDAFVISSSRPRLQSFLIFHLHEAASYPSDLRKRQGLLGRALPQTRLCAGESEHPDRERALRGGRRGAGCFCLLGGSFGFSDPLIRSFSRHTLTPRELGLSNAGPAWDDDASAAGVRAIREAPRPRRLRDTYRFPGFCPRPVVGIFGDPHPRILHGAIPLHVRDVDYPHEGSRRSAGECSGTRRDTRMPYALVRIMSRSQRNTYARNS
jgi:hypothetical protein